MPEEFHLSYEGTILRVRYDSPEVESFGTCLLIPSGHVGSYDQEAGETALYEPLIRELNKKQIGVLRLDMQRRGDVHQPAGPTHLAARTSRVRRLLAEPKLAPYLQSYVMCGMSLGAQTALQLITTPGIPADPLGIILISCVVEEPKTVLSNAQWIEFIYGSRDHIAYVETGSYEVLTAIPPDEYGPRSASMLIMRPRQRCGLHIFEGLGHLLLNGENQEDNPAVAWLTSLIVDMLSPNTKKIMPVGRV